MLRENMEVLRDNKGRTLYGHVTGEAVIIHKCGTKMVKPRRDEKRCCHELPICMGDDFKTPAFMKPVAEKSQPSERQGYATLLITLCLI